MNTASALDSLLTREMSITHKDFFRLLPRAVNGAPVTRDGNHASITTNAGQINISLMPETVRKLGLLEFPVTHVSMEFNGFTPTDQAAFLARFELAYQRGGG